MRERTLKIFQTVEKVSTKIMTAATAMNNKMDGGIMTDRKKE